MDWLINGKLIAVIAHFASRFWAGGISAPGSLARFVNPDLLKQLLNNPEAYQDTTLDFEEQYDSDINNLGLGVTAGEGLLVSAIKTLGK